MELTLTVTPDDMNDQFGRVSVWHDDLRCEECNRIIINLTGRSKTRAKIILAMSMHTHGIDTP